MASVTLLGLKTKEKSGRREPITYWTWDSGDHTSKTAMKNQKSYHTGTKRAPELQWPLEPPPQDRWKRFPCACGWHVEGGRLKRYSGITNQVPALNTCWIAQFLQNSNEVAIFLNLCALTLIDTHSSSEADSHVWLMTDLIHNNMVPRDTHFFLWAMEIVILEIQGQYWSVQESFFLKDTETPQQFVSITTHNVN